MSQSDTGYHTVIIVDRVGNQEKRCTGCILNMAALTSSTTARLSTALPWTHAIICDDSLQCCQLVLLVRPEPSAEWLYSSAGLVTWWSESEECQKIVIVLLYSVTG